MATAIRTIGHEERLSVVDHLEELRARLIVSAAAVALVFAVCLWQNHALLRFVNEPLRHQTAHQIAQGKGPLGQTWAAQQAVRRLAGEEQAALAALSAPGSGLPAATRALLAAQAPRLQADVSRLPKAPAGDVPTTLGVAEPFTTTLTVVFYFALVLALPVVLFELYGFVLPALRPAERRTAVPLLMAVPFLFVAGLAFGYAVVLPAAVRFLQNFNSEQFNVLVQASAYYRFAATVLLAMGLAFQAPVAILGAVKAGIVSPRTLRRNRRYALLLCATLAALLPGDLFTMVLETVPLYLLYEVSILIAAVVARRDARGSAAQATAGGIGSDPPAGPQGPAGEAPPLQAPPASEAHGGRGSDTIVNDKIDHIDPEFS